MDVSDEMLRCRRHVVNEPEDGLKLSSPIGPCVHGLNVTFEKRKTRSQHEAQGASKKPN